MEFCDHCIEKISEVFPDCYDIKKVCIVCRGLLTENYGTILDVSHVSKKHDIFKICYNCVKKFIEELAEDKIYNPDCNIVCITCYMINDKYEHLKQLSKIIVYDDFDITP